MMTALYVYLIFTTTHLIFHVMEPSNLLSDRENAVNLLIVGSAPILTVVLLYACRAKPDPSLAEG